MKRRPTAAEIRVAKALWERQEQKFAPYARIPWGDLTAKAAELVLDQAHVAIRALHEPDDDMLAAYMGALEQPADPKKEPWHQAKMRRRWRAMIDAASPPEANDNG